MRANESRRNSSLVGFDWVERERGSALVLSLVCCAGAGVLSCGVLYSHLRHYTRPTLQKYIGRILVLIPLYALLSFCSFAAVHQAVVFDTIRDCYESFVVYSFLALVLSYTGGEANCVRKIQYAQEKGLPHPFPCSFCLSDLPRDGRLVRNCKQATLQFVVLKPLVAFISLFMMLINKYDTVWYQWTLSIVYNLSYSIALYALLIFYMATKPILTNFSPVCKFFAVKSVIFLTFWQTSLISYLPGITKRQSLLWKDFILCLEMPFFAVMYAVAFNAKEFHKTYDSMPEQKVLANMKEVLSVKDIVADAYHNFMPSYQEYVLQDLEQETVVKTRTFLAGNLDTPTPASSNSEKELEQEEDEEVYFETNFDEVSLEIESKEEKEDSHSNAVKEEEFSNSNNEAKEEKDESNSSSNVREEEEEEEEEKKE